MKRKITLSIALVLSIVLVALTSSDSPVAAQNQLRIVADTGFIAATLDQDINSLRVTVNTGAGDDAIAVRFRRIDYTQIACDGGICKHEISAQTTSDPIILQPGEAVSLNVQGNQIGTDGVRIVVLSSSRNVRVNGSIIDAVTGAVVTSYSFGITQTGG
jgi:hypothetical protein